MIKKPVDYEDILETIKEIKEAHPTEQTKEIKPLKQIFADDDRLNYCFMKLDDIENPNSVYKQPEWLDKELIDYDIVIKKGQEDTDELIGTLDKTLPSSYFTIKTVEEGVDWYLKKNPDLPESVAEIMARYTWGDKQEKKIEDVSKKKNKKKKKPDGLEVKKGKFLIDFS
jgi:hypothetical protein